MLCLCTKLFTPYEHNDDTWMWSKISFPFLVDVSYDIHETFFSFSIQDCIVSHSTIHNNDALGIYLWILKSWMQASITMIKDALMSHAKSRILNEALNALNLVLLLFYKKWRNFFYYVVSWCYGTLEIIFKMTAIMCIIH